MKKPVIAIPIGDPAGVGPEIVAKSIASDEVFQIAVCVIVGDRKIVEKAIEITGENLKINEIKEPEEAVDEKGVLNLINLDNVDMDTFAYGKVSAMCGKAAYEYIAKSIELANAGKVDAVATTPINKESLHAAEVPYIGHTEIFGALTHTEDPLTMFETNGMRVFFLTRHVSLRQMLDMIKKDRIIDYVKRCTKALERLGVKEGTMAIAGLNPHRIDFTPYMERYQCSLDEVTEMINSGFAEITYRIFKAEDTFKGLYTSGGDITVAVCKKFDTAGLSLLDEVLPLAAYGQFLKGEFEGVHIITKGGSQGNKDAINKCITYLKEKLYI